VSSIKTYNFDELLKKQLRNQRFKKAYDDLEAEYALASQVIRFRIEQNLTQAELARRVGTSQPAIARLESGNHTNVTLSFLFRVARALELKPELRLAKIGRRSKGLTPDRTSTTHRGKTPACKQR
jgi:DNA-binding XRE family transcriptional regulator